MYTLQYNARPCSGSRHGVNLAWRTDDDQIFQYLVNWKAKRFAIRSVCTFFSHLYMHKAIHCSHLLKRTSLHVGP